MRLGPALQCQVRSARSSLGCAYHATLCRAVETSAGHGNDYNTSPSPPILYAIAVSVFAARIIQWFATDQCTRREAITNVDEVAQRAAHKFAHAAAYDAPMKLGPLTMATRASSQYNHTEAPARTCVAHCVLARAHRADWRRSLLSIPAALQGRRAEVMETRARV